MSSFLSRQPGVYADMFAERLAKSGANLWLLNTGWTEGDAANLRAKIDGRLAESGLARTKAAERVA